MSAEISLLQHSRLRITYRSSNSQGFSVYPRLVLNFEVIHNISAGTSPYTIAISDFVGHLSMIVEGGPTYYLSQLLPRQSYVSLSGGSTQVLSFGLNLSHYGLRQIEKLREAKDLVLTANIGFVAEIHQQPQTRAVSGFQVQFRIPKSDWVETILPQMGYKTVSLLEIPQLMDPESQQIIDYINGAWKQHSMGEYNRVLSDCRKALEALSTKIRKKGFEKDISEEEGRKRKVPDWGKLLGNKDLGGILGTLNQKITGFVTPGSHAGKSVNKEDADFALMTTHAIVNLASKKLLSS